MGKARAYWVTAPGQGEIRAGALASTGDTALQLTTLASGISPGTERLVGLGQVPPDARDVMRCAYMEGDFSLPVKYGYSLVGRDADGSRYFAMHPHQDAVVLRGADALRLPDSVPATRAILFPALETAQNALWDAELQTGEPLLVVGAGLIGLLVAYLLARETGDAVSIVEADSARRRFLSTVPWVRPEDPASPPQRAPAAVFHCSSSESGLQWSIDHSDHEARIIELSWYGSRAVAVRLGSSFHYGRKRLISSQVSCIAAPVRDRIDRAGRSATVLAHLEDSALDVLLQPVIPFDTLPAAMASLYHRREQLLAPVVIYPGNGAQE